MKKPNPEKILKEAECFYKELIAVTNDLNPAPSSYVPQPIMLITEHIKVLLYLEEKSKSKLSLEQERKLYILLGRLYAINTDYTVFAKTQNRIYKNLSRAVNYLRKAYQLSTSINKKDLEIGAECGIMCIRLAWTLMSSTTDEVERLVQNIDWSEFLTESEIKDLIIEAQIFLEECLIKRPKGWTHDQWAKGLESLGLAYSLTASTINDYNRSANAYLKSAQVYKESGNIGAEKEVIANAIAEFTKAGNWKSVIENGSPLFDLSLTTPEGLSQRKYFDFLTRISSNLATALYHMGNINEANSIATNWSNPLLSQWVSIAQSCNSLEDSIKNAKSYILGIADSFLEEDALDKNDYSGTSIILHKLFQNEGRRKPTEVRKIPRIGLPKGYNVKDNIPNFSSNTALVELICCHPETIVFITLADGSKHSFILPKLTKNSLQEKLVVFSEGQPKGGWLDSYLSYRKAIIKGTYNSSPTEYETLRSSLFDSLDRMLLWLYEVFGEPLCLELNKLKIQSNYDIDHLILVPGPLLGFLPLHGAYIPKGLDREYLSDKFCISYCPIALPLQVFQSKHNISKKSNLSLFTIRDISRPTFFMQLDHYFAQRGLGLDKASNVEFSNYPTKADWEHLDNYLRCCTHLLVSSHGIADLKRSFINSGLFLGQGSSNVPMGDILAMLKDKRLKRDQPRPNVSIRDLIRLPLYNCKLAFLGSCEGAMSSSLPSADGGISPATALLISGVEQVVASMWLADSLSCTLICKWLFENVGNGMPYSVALRTAQQKIRTSNRAELFEELAEGSGLNKEILSEILNLDYDDPNIMNERLYRHPWFWVGYQHWVRSVACY